MGHAATAAAKQVVRDEGPSSHEKGGHVFGDNKVFVIGVHKQLKKHGYKGSLDKLKGELADAHQKGTVEMTRADLSGSLPAKHVEASETPRNEARYHFVVAKSMALARIKPPISSHKLQAKIAGNAKKEQFSQYRVTAPDKNAPYKPGPPDDANQHTRADIAASSHLKAAINHAHTEALAHHHAGDPVKARRAMKDAHMMIGHLKNFREGSQIDWDAGKKFKKQHKDVKAVVGRKIINATSSEKKPKQIEKSVLQKSDAHDCPHCGHSFTPSDKTKSSAKDSGGDFEHHFDASFKKRQGSGLNLVGLHHLRSDVKEKMPHLTHEQFNDHLYEMRKKKKYTLAPFEGRHDKMSDDHKNSAIKEGDREFHYAIKRDIEKAFTFNLAKSEGEFTEADHVKALRFHAKEAKSATTAGDHEKAATHHWLASHHANSAAKLHTPSAPAQKTKTEAAAAPAPKTEAAPAKEHDHEKFHKEFATAFEKHRQHLGHNLVELHHLRADLPHHDKETFDKHALKLRRDRHYALETHDGRHGVLSDKAKEGAITQGGRNFVYASKW